MNAIEQAGIIYPLLVKAARDRTTVTYGDVREKLGYDNTVSGQAFRFGLDIIVFYCLKNNYPQLTTLIVNKANGLPSDTYAYDKDIDYSEEQSNSFNHSWSETFDYTGIWDMRFELREKYDIG